MGGQRTGRLPGVAPRLTAMASVLVVSGAGAYADPWHPFVETSACLRDLIASLGHRVTVCEDVENSLLSLGSTGLVVINVGNPKPPRPESIMTEIQASLLAHLERGGGLLGMHVSATSFTTMPCWPKILGGSWIRGTTRHPPCGPARIRLHPGAHPAAGDRESIEVFDERYSYLDVRADVTVLGDHSLEGVTHPMIWARQPGPGRVVYDGLGHDARSFDSRGHRALLARAVAWLLGEDG